MATYNVNLTKKQITNETHYSIYSEDTNRGWAYRQVVNHLVNLETVTLDKQEIGIIGWDTAINAEEQRENEPVTVNAYTHIKVLKSLSVPVIDKKQFTLRNFIHPMDLESTILHIFKTDGAIGIDYLLTPERRAEICKMALIEKNTLDQNINLMLQYSSKIEEGTTSGTYGRFLIII